MTALANTYEAIWNEVHGHSMSVDPLLVQSWVRDTWREVAESRTWSWLRKRGLITIPAAYSTGTVALTPGETRATFTGATLTLNMIGRQFRVSTTGHIYQITNVDTAASTAEIFPPYNDTAAAVSGVSYKIFTAYITPPDIDFFAWLSVTNPSVRKRLRLEVQNSTIDYYDANRASTSISPACLSGVDWSESYAGKVYSTLQVVGSGPAPVASGSYTGSTDSLLVVKITTGGVRDTAQFSSQKDGGTITTGQTVSSGGNGLPEGVTLTWPNSTFILNDVFVIRLAVRPQYGMPRYEIYPHPTSNTILSCMYSTRVRDIDEPDFVLPYTMRSDIIKLGALAKMARYPGTNDKPNPFAQIARAQAYEEKFEIMLGELRTADDYIMETNVIDGVDQWEFALLPWMSSSGAGLRRSAAHDPFDIHF